MADNIEGLKSALQKERELNREIKALDISMADLAAIKAGADLHGEFKAFMRQRDELAARDAKTLAAERDAARVQASRDAAAFLLSSEIVALGGNRAAVDLVTCKFVDRIRIDPNNRNNVTILTETGQPALAGTTVRDLAQAAKAKFPSLFPSSN